MRAHYRYSLLIHTLLLMDELMDELRDEIEERMDFMFSLLWKSSLTFKYYTQNKLITTFNSLIVHFYFNSNRKHIQVVGNGLDLRKNATFFTHIYHF